MAREQVTPDFPHTTFSVRTLKVDCESLAPQPSCGNTGAEEEPAWRPPWPVLPTAQGGALPWSGCTHSCRRT